MTPLKHRAMRLVRGLGVPGVMRWLSRYGIRIVTYHGVERHREPVVNFDALQTPPEVFRSHLELYRQHYRVRPLVEVLSSLRGRKLVEPHTLVLTFDDGYLNNLEVAAPMLRGFGFHATFFITTGFVEGVVEPWWYRLRAVLAGSNEERLEHAAAPNASLRTVADRIRLARRLEQRLAGLPIAERDVLLAGLIEACGAPETSPRPRFMTPEQVRELTEEGFDVGGHTHRHVSLSAESDEVAAEEVRTSLRKLKAWCGSYSPVFCYPYGRQPQDSSALRRVFREEGIEAAVTVERGLNRPGQDPYHLKRFDIHGNRDRLNVEVLLAGGGWGRE